MERGLWQNQSDADSTTLADALDRYGREVSALKKSGKIELYRIDTLKTDKIAKLHLSRIRGADLAEYRDRRLAAGLSDSSLRLELAILFEKDLNPMQVAAITGHKTLQMLKRYTHLRAEDLAKLLG